MSLVVVISGRLLCCEEIIQFERIAANDFQIGKAGGAVQGLVQLDRAAKCNSLSAHWALSGVVHKTYLTKVG
jgi:hypothetical protein